MPHQQPILTLADIVFDDVASLLARYGLALEHVTDAYKRFLEGRFRKEFNLVGTPLRIDMKTSHNPYADKD